MTPEQITAEIAAATQHFAAGRMEEARVISQRVLEASPDDADALHILGLIRFQDGLADDGIDLLVRALEQRPRSADILVNLGQLQMQRGEYDAACDCFAAALDLTPEDLTLRLRLAATLSRLGRDDEAVAAYRAILGRVRGYLPAHHDLAIHYQSRNRREEALAEFEIVQRLDPGDLASYSMAVRLRQALCRWESFGKLRAELIEPALRPEVVSRLPSPFIVLALPVPVTSMEFHTIVTKFARAQPTLQSSPRIQFPQHDVGKRLRVGYLSSDLGNHPVGRVLNGLLGHHDRSRLEVVAYALSSDDGSEERRKNTAAVDRLVDLAAIDTPAAAHLIRADGIDILIDLNGHTAGNRLDIAALRPAPVQVTWLGFPGTTGMPSFDYLLGDGTVTPETAQPHYSENLVQLPNYYYAVPPAPMAQAPSRASLGLPETGFVFCSFGAVHKVEPRVFDVWMRLLASVLGSVMWLWVENDTAVKNLRHEAKTRGIDPARLVIAPGVPHGAHMARHRAADLFLDTLLYGAHTTAADALAAGLPMVTCTGETFASRVGTSLLRAVGLPDLVAPTPAEYEALALRLARDPGALATIRQRLKAAHATAPMFNPKRFVMHFEAALRQMWDNHAAGNPPRPFAVPPL